MQLRRGCFLLDVLKFFIRDAVRGANHSNTQVLRGVTTKQSALIDAAKSF